MTSPTRTSTTGARLAAVAAVAGVLLLTPSPASASTYVAGYRMDETSGRTMHDVARRYDGTVGSDVRLTGGTYKFLAPPAAYRPQHLVTVPNATALNPGTGTWSMTARFRYTQSSGNIVQKGQAGGSYFKLESRGGSLSCLFRGASGSKSVGTGTRHFNDGLWHTVTCKRSGSTVSLVIDGNVRSGTGVTGSITNTRPLSIGGKTACNGDSVGCDYWIGEMDYLRVEVG